MSKIGILVDTGADIPQELLEKYGINQMNFMVNFGDESYIAGEEMTNAQFYAKISETGIHPKTSQTPYAEMHDVFTKLCKEYETVIFYTISAKASGQNHTAHMVADEIMEDNPSADIRIVDTKSFSTYVCDAAITAAKLANEGAEADEVIEKSLEAMKEWEVYLLVDNLDYLEKGGRITKTAAIVGALLDIKPILTIRDGLIEPYSKLRGKKKIFSKLIAQIKEDPAFDAENPGFLVTHSNKDYAAEVTALLEEEFGKGVVYMQNEFGPIIGTHTGPGALAVLFRIK